LPDILQANDFVPPSTSSKRKLVTLEPKAEDKNMKEQDIEDEDSDSERFKALEAQVQAFQTQMQSLQTTIQDLRKSKSSPKKSTFKRVKREPQTRTRTEVIDLT